MKKFLLLMLAAASFASAAPSWNAAVKLKEIWVVPGPTPIVRLMMDDGASNPYYAFYLNESSKDLLAIAKEAIAANLFVKVYADKGLAPIYYSGMTAPFVSQVSAVYPLYTLAIAR